MPVFCFSWCHTVEENTVKEINLSNSALRDVPTSLFLYERTLDTLILSSNRILDLPLPLFYCQNLQILNLSDNEIAVLPSAIGFLAHLKTLDLNRNCIEDICDSIKSCKKLLVLNISMNPLKQFPEPVTQLISLEELYLNDTSLDYLPANIGRLVQLRILELRDNRLSTLPKAFARFSRLVRLDIGQNDFNYLPDVVGELQELQELWLDLNATVIAPHFLGNIKKLTHLDMSENSLDCIPGGIGDCNMLTELTLLSNDLKSLPPSMGRITCLVTLKLEFNDLTELPATIGDLTNLEELNVSYNNLETIPFSVGLLRNLVCLILDSNHIRLLPPEIGSCYNLRVLTVQNNLLESIPAEIGNLHNLSVLSLTNNHLRCLPLSVLKMTNLKALWLVYNQSKPLTPLVRDYDSLTGNLVLTCYLLPQTTPDHEQHHDEGQVTVSNCKTSEKPRIRFSIATGTPAEKQGLLNRAPTPYPKKLRELAKCARAIVCQTSSSTDQTCELSIVNSSGTNSMGIKVRTAVVKKPASSMGQEGEIIEQRQQLPPPYHIAATFSKQARLFQNGFCNNKEERRNDIDTKTLSSLKDELLHNLPLNKCPMSQSEQSGSVELIYPESLRLHSVAMSDVDSAFVDNIESNYKTMVTNNVDSNQIVPCPRIVNDKTYAAYPGIIISGSSSKEHLPLYDSSRYPISKVNSWLSSKTKTPVASENSCEFINMYPCENTQYVTSDSNQNIDSKPSSATTDRKLDEANVSPKTTKHSKLPWLFGVHRNPKVVEVTVNKIGHDLGFDITFSNSGVYVKSVSKVGEAGQVLKAGDKILQIEGLEVKDHACFSYIISSLEDTDSPFTMMISRPT